MYKTIENIFRKLDVLKVVNHNREDLTCILTGVKDKNPSYY